MPDTDKWVDYFAAQKVYFEHHPWRAEQCHTSSPHSPTIVFHGTKAGKVTIGRGNGNGVQVGRRNPRMSRQHLILEHKPHTGYTLTVKSPNGVLVDRIMFMAGEHIPLVKGSLIEVLGTRLVFGGEKQQHDDDGDERADTKTTILETTRKDRSPSLKNSTTNCTADQESTAMIDDSKPLLLLPQSKPLDFLDTLIRLLANSRKTSMTIPEIGRQLKRERQSLMDLIDTTACIGCIERTGNTADGTPKEHLYYYKPELDANDERRLALSQSRRGARKCALKDTQYYFRIPPKLPNHRTKSTVDNKRKLHRDPQQSNPSKKPRRSTLSKRSKAPLTTSTPVMITTSSPLSLSSDDLSDDGFLTSDDECSDKELTALFQDV